MACNLAPDLFKTDQMLLLILFIGLMAAQVFMLIVGYALAKVAPAVLRINNVMLGPIILLVCMVSTYAISNNMFDVYVMLIGDIFAYIMRKGGYSIVPMILGLVLGPLFEQRITRAVMISAAKGGFLPYFMTRTTTWIILIITIISVAAPLVWNKNGRKNINKKRIREVQE
jgi:putative tricarboxylic transport membrane protein